jgi:asparagine synthase (glutamine-hydrolysing)
VGLDELMTFWAPVAPRTVFKGVSQVGPGEMVILEGDKLTRRQYWDWDFPAATQHRRESQATLEEELRSILMSATEIRLRADVPVGAYLSGGLDSSTLVALIKERLPDTLETFSKASMNRRTSVRSPNT